MTALLDDLAVPHHQDDVRLPDGGQPVGHDALLARGGFYARLYNSQFETVQ